MFLVAVSLSSCYSWKRGFVEGTGTPEVGKGEEKMEIDIAPQDFFYFRQEEYMEHLNYTVSEGDSYTNEAAARLYRSIPVDSTKPLARVMEEKYMYLDNFSDSRENGQLVYFRTAMYWGDIKDEASKNRERPGKLRDHYTSPTLIELTTTKDVQVGYWYRDTGNIVHLMMNNGSEKFHVVAREENLRLTFLKMSHPNRDQNARETNSELLMSCENVMNVQDKDGLVYYRNMKADSSEERTISFYTKMKTYNVDQIVLVTKPSKRRNLWKGRCYLHTKEGVWAHPNSKRFKYETRLISERDFKFFKKYKAILHRKKNGKKPKPQG